MDVIEELHQSLDERRTPEFVAGLVLRVAGEYLTAGQRQLLVTAASSRAAQYTSMSDDFDRPVPPEHKVRMLVTLIGDLARDDVDEETVTKLAADPWLLLGQLRTLAPFIGWHPGADMASRLNRAQRATNVAGLSRRRYNRLVRHMIRTQERALRMQRQILLRQLTLVGRSGLAYSITVEEMRADPVGACFVAYWVAQRNRRREFTLDSRASPMDELAEMLLVLCSVRGGTDWWMVARAYPAQSVVARLDQVRQGELVGHWLGFMRLGATMLRDLYRAWPEREIEPVVPDSYWADRPGLMPSRAARGGRTVKVVDLTTMTVRPGIDSSTWNTVAQAYNAARAGWINSLAATGALDLLEVMCPGKAMRLMAADLASYHRLTGGRPDPDTLVWADLRKPWDVLEDDGKEPLVDVDVVEYTCLKHGVDPHAKGWTAPRQTGAAVAWAPTPDLVHGIEVADPLWAGLLRRAGVFSGKKVKPDAGEVFGAYAAEKPVGGLS